MINKMYNNKFSISSVACFAMLLGVACNKLETKPDQSLAVPNSLQDLQAILDYSLYMSTNYVANGDIAADMYYLNESDWSARNANTRNAYIWQPNADDETDWDYGYKRIFYCNVVLGNVDKAESGNLGESDRLVIKGAALFFRAWTWMGMAQIYTKPFDANTADADLGIPLKVSADLNEQIFRPSLREFYGKLIADLEEAASLLPLHTGVPSRPNKQAALAALSRLYLWIGDYPKALEMARAALDIKAELIDYNAVSQETTLPFDQFNSEVIFHCSIISSSGALAPARAKVDTLLYSLYAEEDLRKHLFFRENPDGSYAFKGDYGGANSAALFAGLAVDELYLNKAECLVRLGEVNEGIAVLNKLRERRLAVNSYGAYEATDLSDPLAVVLEERRRELAFRAGIRWADLRRLNREEAYQQTLKRMIGGEVYELRPNDDRFTFLIPSSVIDFNNIEQND